MSFRLFERDPEALPKPRKKFADDLVGRFRSGHVLNGRPVALEKWRVTTGDPEVAEAVQQLLGGEEPQEWDSKGEDRYEVFTEARSVSVLVSGPEALRQEMVLRNINGKFIRRCDGVEQHGEGAEGQPCVCPASFDERKAAAKDGIGCVPNVVLFFRLLDAPDLGMFKFASSSWSLVRDLAYDKVEEKLYEMHGDYDGRPIVVKLGLEVVKWETKDGKKRQFTKPVIKVVGPAPEEASENEDDEPPF